LLERWGVVNTEAAASYNSILNTIILKPATLSHDEKGKLRIASVSELRSRENAYTVTISTIFHELAHAEQDMFLDQAATKEDEALLRVMKEEIKPWISRNHPELSPFSRNIALWEIFGYYHGDLMSLLMSDREDILAANGFYQNRCVFSKHLKALAKSLSLEEFTMLLPIGEDFQKSYGERFRLEMVWALGKDVELFWKNVNDPFRQEWQDALFQHFRAFYAIPDSKQKLLDRMNRRVPNALRSCRADFWRKVHNQANF